MANIYYPKLASELGGQNWDPGHTPVAAQAAREVVSLPILPLGSQDESFERVCAAVRLAADVAAS